MHALLAKSSLLVVLLAIARPIASVVPPPGYFSNGTVNFQCPLNFYCPGNTSGLIPCSDGGSSPIGSSTAANCTAAPSDTPFPMWTLSFLALLLIPIGWAMYAYRGVCFGMEEPIAQRPGLPRPDLPSEAVAVGMAERYPLMSNVAYVFQPQGYHPQAYAGPHMVQTYAAPQPRQMRWGY